MKSYNVYFHTTNALGDDRFITIDADELHYDRDFIKFYNKGTSGGSGYPMFDNMVAIFPVASVRYIIKKGNNTENAESKVTGAAGKAIA